MKWVTYCTISYIKINRTPLEAVLILVSMKQLAIPYLYLFQHRNIYKRLTCYRIIRKGDIKKSIASYLVLIFNNFFSYEDDINALMDIALEKVAFLPFGLLIDKWRWDVFSGSVSVDQWNTHWWEYRKKYQKIKAPVERSDTDFDPGAKFHVPSDSQYIA